MGEEKEEEKKEKTALETIEEIKKTHKAELEKIKTEYDKKLKNANEALEAERKAVAEREFKRMTGENPETTKPSEEEEETALSRLQKKFKRL